MLRQLQDILKVTRLEGLCGRPPSLPSPSAAPSPASRGCRPSADCVRDAPCSDQALPSEDLESSRGAVADNYPIHKQPCERGGPGLSPGVGEGLL